METIKTYGIKENDNLNREFVEQHLLYDNMGLAERFYKRYANIYKKVDGIGICKYDGNGKYLPKQENSLYKDIQTTILSTYYEFDYIIENEVLNLSENYGNIKV